ncbi:MAG: Lipopolysaccharide heptosyltransferase I (EC [uncultured Sulfurovum sp.]|uniref:Lipopolysaccharide heptosyltransferase 1 n=1 Tax=uncultured Sulfurovum sp. TaxID=269237 RepID=A0A6S6TUC9_9BACT|nr:MAG: Lipopolysaccharide heptosyltransferase I (EC [uncultured Sulfurovum sp.]
MKIAIVKLSAMGDIIHAMIAVQFIKQAKPEIQIDWIVEQGFAQVLAHNPHIDNILALNLKAIKKNKMALFTEVKKINTYAKNNYDLVIDAQGLLKSAITSKLLGKKVIGFSKASIREGVSSYFYDEKIAIAYEKNAIERNIKVLCEPLAISVSKEQILNKEAFLYFKTSQNLLMEIDTIKNYLLLVVGASVKNKIYPKEKFLKVVQNINEKVFVIWANDYEKEVAEYLARKANNVIACPKLNLDELKHVIAKSKLVIGGDTGPTHMAWALNVPSITLFGNTPEYRNTYITPINQVLKSKTKVNPLKLDKNDFSIQEIDPNSIIELAKELLNA